MEYRFANDEDLDLLSNWNHQLIEDEGHRNPMTIAQLGERMKGWLSANYKAVIFENAEDPLAYALFLETESEIYLRQMFVRRDKRRSGIGRQAMSILQNDIWPQNKRLTVGVLSSNKDALLFWRSVGYNDYSITLEKMPPVLDQQKDVPLTGGGRTAVFRNVNTVIRETGPWAKTVHALLKHLEKVGYTGAPRVIGSGFDDKGRETLSYLEGEFVHPRPWAEEAMPYIGKLLRELHDATMSFPIPEDAVWRKRHGRTLGGPDYLIGHCDTGPWNILAQNGLPVASD